MKHLLLPALFAAAAAAAAPLSAQHSFSTGTAYDPAIPTPQSVLGYDIGERFTPHHLLHRYVERVAQASPRVTLDTVARSFEGREVLLAIVTSEANHQRLDAIRSDAARIADPRRLSAGELSTIGGRLPAIAWLGFTVHGPEASGAEAAMALLYQLAAGRDAETQMMLDSVVVLIDPLQNPDGHERHAQDVIRMRGAMPVPVHPEALIHQGNWPGPRTSHYYFDLNRDWFTISHPETRGRVRSMLSWYPHVAIDLHEMGSSSSYFFPPPMEPLNKLIQPVTQKWWDIIAASIIEHFDRHGWSYFRREGYDEFYPGYGSSWPVYIGAVGSTYEQASSRGGRIRRDDGTVLTLREAAHHHYTAAYATILATARRARERVRDYVEFRRSAVSDSERDAMRAIVFQRDGQGRADSLAWKLVENGIDVGRLAAGTEIRNANEYGGGRASTVRLAGGGWVVDLAQPHGRLARAILEPDAPLDSAFIREELERRRTGQEERFYDLTAWAMPYTYRVKAWWTGAPVAAQTLITHRDSSWQRHFAATAADGASANGNAARAAEARYGYAFAPGSESSIRLLARLLADSIRVWYAPKSFTSGGQSFPTGAFLVRVAPNDSTVHARLRRHADSAKATVAALASAAVERGTDLGSNSVVPVRAPRVAMAGRGPISGQSFGYAWYAFDQRIGYPVTTVDIGDVDGGLLRDFDVLVIPSVSAAGLARALGEGGKEGLDAWVRGGGTLITLDNATSWLASERSGLSRFRLKSDTAARPDTATGAPLPASVPGAIVRAVVTDPLSPLLAGVEEAEFPVLVFSDRIYDMPKDLRPGEAVIRYALRDRLRLAGYLWPEVPARLGGTPYLFSERVGSGRVIGFAAEPNFRDMWRGLLPVFANAVFLGS